VSPWVPRVVLGLALFALGYAIYSIAVGEGGPKSPPVEGVNDVQEIFGGIEQEGATLGPTDAPITIEVFNDLQCAPCADFELETIDPLVEEYARTDKAQFVFRNFSLAPNDTTLAAIAAEAAGMQARQWQYADTFFRNQDLAQGRGVDDQILREVAEAVPELDQDRWQTDYDSPQSADLVREDAMLAAQLKLPAEPAVVVSGPAGERKLIQTPTHDEIEAAIAQVSGPD